MTVLLVLILTMKTRYGQDKQTLWKTLWLLCTTVATTAIYLLNKFHFNPFCTFQDMTRTGNTYEKWLRGDNSTNMQGRIMVLGFCPSPHCHLSIYMY